VLAFSFTLPATRLAVHDLDATVVGLGRALVAALLAASVLALRHEPLPAARHLPSLAVVALGIVVGFPLCTSLALAYVPASHGAVIVGLVPAATAAMAVLRAGERPSVRFWIAVAAGLIAVLAFAATQGAVSGTVTVIVPSLSRPQAGDLLILLAVALAALGYAEGGALAREIGGWRVICWALLLAAPFLAPVVAWKVAEAGLHGGVDAWLGFAYVSVFSMFLGFFAWYRGLARGGVARIGQLQLAQPVLTLLWSALILGERFGPATVVFALAVLGCAGITQRFRTAPPPDRAGIERESANADPSAAGSRRPSGARGGLARESSGVASPPIDAAATSKRSTFIMAWSRPARDVPPQGACRPARRQSR